MDDASGNLGAGRVGQAGKLVEMLFGKGGVFGTASGGADQERAVGGRLDVVELWYWGSS